MDALPRLIAKHPGWSCSWESRSKAPSVERYCFLRTFRPGEGLRQERTGKAKPSFAAKLGPRQGHVLTGATSGCSHSPGLDTIAVWSFSRRPSILSAEDPPHGTLCRQPGLVKGEGSVLVSNPHPQSASPKVRASAGYLLRAPR